MVSVFLTGGILMIEGCGFSVARAIAARVSITILTHNNCTVFKGETPFQHVPKNTVTRQDKLAVT